MRIASTISDSIVDGPGLRFTVFTQGCAHACPGCHNPETHDIAGGHEERVETLAELMGSNPLTGGLTLSGGDPFLQAADCAALAKIAHAQGKDVWTYTGYTWEAVLAAGRPDWRALLEETDVLVDGPFRSHERSLDLLYRGSKNQRLIDMPATLKGGTIRLYAPPEW